MLADPAPAGSPWWLVLALAAISAAAVVLAAVLPKAVERGKDKDAAKPATPKTEADPPSRADSALLIVQDVVDDLQAQRDRLQERLDQRDAELAAANRRITELLDELLRGRNA